MNSNWSYSLEMPNLGQNQQFFEPCVLEIWRMTSKNNRVPLLINIKLCASFHLHMLIQTGVTDRKRLSGVLTSVTLTFGLWPWPFAWTSLLSLYSLHIFFITCLKHSVAAATALHSRIYSSQEKWPVRKKKKCHSLASESDSVTLLNIDYLLKFLYRLISTVSIIYGNTSVKWQSLTSPTRLK